MRFNGDYAAYWRFFGLFYSVKACFSGSVGVNFGNAPIIIDLKANLLIWPKNSSTFRMPSEIREGKGQATQG